MSVAVQKYPQVARLRWLWPTFRALEHFLGAFTFGDGCQFRRAIFLSRSRFALPNMSRFRYLILQILPSTAPLL
jgi:hypothetical protein